MQFPELAAQSVETLRAQLAEQRNRLQQLRFQVADGTHKKVSELGVVRRQIAQLLTALRQARNPRPPSQPPLAPPAVPAKI